MSILVYAESWNGKFRKSTFEAVSYAYDTAKMLDKKLTTLSLGDISNDELNKLGKYGSSKIINYNNINKSDGQAVSNIISNMAKEVEVIIFSNTYTAKMIAPRLSAKLMAASVSNVIGLPYSKKPLKLKRTAFSSKAIEYVSVETEKAILSISPNSYKIIKNLTTCEIESVTSSEKGQINIEGQENTSGKISLSEAEIIVSAGRGLKGPENWKMVEDLAELLGAATACSKPVSDMGWRPHSEHVGQTGKAVAPNLYIAIGISGAIQHLAGVNSSKYIVAINTDAEAPFFKAADYGIVGDAFEVIPKMIEEIKKIDK